MANLQKVVVLCVVVVLGGAGVWWYVTTHATSTIEEGSSTSGGGGGVLPYTSGVRGVVMLGPTCPVMRDPPDPACADKPYATPVAIYRASDPVHALVLTRSDADGMFEAQLPPGQYTVGAEGGATLPRCATQEFSVAADTYTSVEVSCDSGIR